MRDTLYTQESARRRKARLAHQNAAERLAQLRATDAPAAILADAERSERETRLRWWGWTGSLRSSAV